MKIDVIKFYVSFNLVHSDNKNMTEFLTIHAEKEGVLKEIDNLLEELSPAKNITINLYKYYQEKE